MTSRLTDEQRAAIRERLATTGGLWFLSDCEGDLEIWREAALRDVTRDEHGEIDGYRTPGHYLGTDLIAEWCLDTWDEGKDQDDDERRARARFIAHAPVDIAALLSEIDRLRGIIASLAEPSEELFLTAAQRWRDDRAKAGQLYGNRPVAPDGAIVEHIRMILASALPAILEHLNGGES